MGFDKNKLKVLGISINDKLSAHFTLKEMITSETATRKGIDNTPTEDEVENYHQAYEFIQRYNQAMLCYAISVNPYQYAMNMLQTIGYQ